MSGCTIWDLCVVMQRVKEKGYAMVGDVYESKISSYEGYLLMRGYSQCGCGTIPAPVPSIGQSLMLNNHYFNQSMKSLGCPRSI